MEKKKMCIGFFTDAFFPMIDGVGMVVNNYAKNLQKYADVIVFAPNYSNKKCDDSVFPYKVVRCNSIKMPVIDYSLPLPKLDPKFEREIDKYHLDIVHIHSPFTIGEIGIKYAKKHHVPVVASMHSQYKMDFLRYVKNDYIATKLTSRLIKVYNKCDECWAVNREVARIFYEEYGYKKMPEVMKNATEMQTIDYAETKELDEKYHLKKEKVCLFVGRINALKNIFFIVDVLKKVREIDSKLQFKMLFVGTGQDEEQLKEYVTKSELDDNVIFCGKIENRLSLAKYYARSDLFVFPSLYDTSSLVQIEAASQHRPTIFVKGSATAATVTDEVNGFVEEEDVTLFAKRIISILTDDKKREKIGNNAYRDLYHTWSEVTEEAYNRYKMLIRKYSMEDK